MSDLRAKPTDLCMTEAMPFQQSWEYRTTAALADVLTEKFFLPMRGMLRPGDQITICRYDRLDAAHRDTKLLECATMRVISSGHLVQAVPLMLTSHFKVEEKPAADPAPAAPDIKPSADAKAAAKPKAA